VRAGVDRRSFLDYLTSPPSGATQGSLKTKSSVRCKRSSFASTNNAAASHAFGVIWLRSQVQTGEFDPGSE
jgi:hypothetical protein